jgi:predicted DNA binding CopG/RHH family protein
MLTRRHKQVLQAGLLSLALFVPALSPPLSIPVQAAQRKALAPANAQFNGQVTTLAQDKNSQPATFSLQLKARSVEIRVAPRATRFFARSAEAEVEGLQVGDYAIVVAHRVRKAWVARTIYFDVRPIYALNQITVTGAILKVDPVAKRFVLKTRNRQYRWILVTRRTKFRVDGQLVTLPPLLSKGQTVQVLMHRVGANWPAFEVNLKTTP